MNRLILLGLLILGACLIHKHIQKRNNAQSFVAHLDLNNLPSGPVHFSEAKHLLATDVRS